MIGSLYSERPTWLHRWSAGAKMLALSCLSTVLFAASSPQWLLPLAVASAGVYLSLGPIGATGRRPVMAAAVAGALLCVFHGWLGQAAVGAASALRLVAAACLGVSLTLTTRFDAFLGVLECVLVPLQRFGFASDRLALSLALMVRFTEHFFVQWQKLDEAYRTRTGHAGGWRMLAPLCIQMLMASHRVAEALEARIGPCAPRLPLRAMSSESAPASTCPSK